MEVEKSKPTENLPKPMTENKEEKPIEIAAKQKRGTPRQDEIKEELAVIHQQIASFRSLTNTGLSVVSHKEMKKLQDRKTSLEKELTRLNKRSIWARKNRSQIKQNVEKLCKEDPNAAKVLKSVNRQIPGRPRIETDQPQLLSTILDIVQASSGADERRRTPMIRSVKTLNDLTDELKFLGFNLSRSATYFRLLPRRGLTKESLRHVQTVPVRLLR